MLETVISVGKKPVSPATLARRHVPGQPDPASRSIYRTAASASQISRASWRASSSSEPTLNCAELARLAMYSCDESFEPAAAFALGDVDERMEEQLAVLPAICPQNDPVADGDRA